MVDGEYFKKLEAVARSVKGNDRPFGGIQLILTGDFLQVWTLKTVLFWETKYIARCILDHHSKPAVASSDQGGQE